jgi:thiol-disulfide isomerase/thioredoxin
VGAIKLSYKLQRVRRMKDLIKLILLLCITILISCAPQKNGNKAEGRKVIISGKVLNFKDVKMQLKVEVNRIAFSPETIEPDIDNLGNFSFSFTSYIPSDITIKCGQNFYVLIHPGDSLNIIFDSRDRDLLKSIRFSGSASKSNQDLAAFQDMYFTNSLNTDYSSQLKALKDYDTNDYLAYCDSIRSKKNEIYKQFLLKYSPNDETRNWISTFLENDFYYNIAWYPTMHTQIDNLNQKQFNVPVSYYNKINEMLPITKSKLACTWAINLFINYYFYIYIFNNIKDLNSKGVSDSLIIPGIIKLVPDDLARQLLLTYKINQDLKFMNINDFEKYKDEITKRINEPYLKEPLFQAYSKIKDELENPRIAADAELSNYDSLSIKQIMDSILVKNKGKVIYLDCWATWCGPCIAEMPGSKELMKEFNGKDVAFVYICIDSKEKNWKAAIGNFQLTGQHYFLNKKQSDDIRKTYGITGVPDYFLINKKGVIKEKGFNLQPSTVKVKIERLLE